MDRFSKWPTAQVCKNADTRTVLKFLTEYFTNNGTPQCIRTDNGSCFKSSEFKKFCKGENIKRIRCTPNLHTGTGLVERTIRTIKSLTRANIADGLKFEDSVQLAIKSIRQTAHSRLNMTLFQMHLGRKPRTALTNLIGEHECLLSNWKRTLTNYISAQPTELQVVTINDTNGGMADYLVINDTRKRNRPVSREFKNYQFYEKENKPNSMKCGFKTNKIFTAVKETDHTVTTSEGRVIYKKLASKPLKFQTLKRTEEQRRTISRCRKCGKFSSGELCETHRNPDTNNNDADEVPSTSRALPTMPEKSKYKRVVMYDSSSRDSESTDTSPGGDNLDSEEEEEDRGESDIRAEIGREIERLREQTPAPTMQVGCSTGRANNPPQLDHHGTPIHRQTQQTPLMKPLNREKR